MNDSPSVQTGLDRLTADLRHLETSNLVMVGIHTGGVWLAEHLHQALAPAEPLSTLNISFHRDDFTRIGLHPSVGPSDIRSDIENRTVLLVDDVLYTGRTVRAAMNELFDFGRPRAIRLAVLVDRSGRELPVAADFVGIERPLPPDRQIKLKGPEPLVLEEQ